MPPSVASSTASLTRPSGGSGRAASEPGARLPGGEWRAVGVCVCVCVGWWVGGGVSKPMRPPSPCTRARLSSLRAARALCSPSPARSPGSVRPLCPCARALNCRVGTPLRADAFWYAQGHRRTHAEPLLQPRLRGARGFDAGCLRSADAPPRSGHGGGWMDGGGRARGERAHVIPYQKRAPAVARATVTKRKAKRQKTSLTRSSSVVTQHSTNRAESGLTSRDRTCPGAFLIV